MVYILEHVLIARAHQSMIKGTTHYSDAQSVGLDQNGGAAADHVLAMDRICFAGK
jgi:hypothetical protein